MALGSSGFGAEDKKIQAVWEFQTSELFTDAERAALELAQAAASVPNGVTPEIANDLKQHWDDDAIVEILAEIALMGFLNRWNDSMGIELEDTPREIAERVLSAGGWSTGKHAPMP